jgi:hypothetical protein
MTAVGLVAASILFAGFSALALNGVQPTLDMLQAYLHS